MQTRSQSNRVLMALVVGLILGGIPWAGLPGTTGPQTRAAPPMPIDDPPTASPDQDDAAAAYAQAIAFIEDRRFEEGIAILETLVSDDLADADTYTYLGFAHRQIGAYDDALAYYGQALALDPNHLGAIEYRGQTYLAMGNEIAAEQALARLSQLCPSGCDERESLARAIDNNAPSY